MMYIRNSKNKNSHFSEHLRLQEFMYAKEQFQWEKYLDSRSKHQTVLPLQEDTIRLKFFIFLSGSFSAETQC